MIITTIHWHCVIARLSIKKTYWHLYNWGRGKTTFYETPLLVLLCHFLSIGVDFSQFQVVKASTRCLWWKSISLNGSHILSKEIQFCLHSSFVISSLCRANCLLIFPNCWIKEYVQAAGFYSNIIYTSVPVYKCLWALLKMWMPCFCRIFSVRSL